MKSPSVPASPAVKKDGKKQQDKAATKASTKGSSSSTSSSTVSSFSAVLLCSVLLGAVNYAPPLPSIHEHFELGPRASTKPFHNMGEFYPFYRSEHQDHTCRLLHVIGTSLAVLLALTTPKTTLAMIAAGCIGMFLSPLLAGFQTGIVEGAAVLLLFLVFNYLFTGHTWRGLLVLLCGYSFAWVGHFYFEHNKPASWIYPTYSLFSDFKMLFNILFQIEQI